MGTDATPDQPLGTMKEIFTKMLTDKNPDITDEFLRVMQSEEFKKHTAGD